MVEMLARPNRPVYTIRVDYTWDPAKAASNFAKHGVAFETVAGFEWETALVIADVRFSYPEPRLTALGTIGSRVYFLAYTVERRAMRIISLRKANNREIDRYEEQD